MWDQNENQIEWSRNSEENTLYLQKIQEEEDAKRLQNRRLNSARSINQINPKLAQSNRIRSGINDARFDPQIAQTKNPNLNPSPYYSNVSSNSNQTGQPNSIPVVSGSNYTHSSKIDISWLFVDPFYDTYTSKVFVKGLFFGFIFFLLSLIPNYYFNIL